ncbi:MAG: hypothetical protein EOL87_15485 [Spartobacteria bacterium]|nr:hypothetical protein [Spartobacteria bacterium]
MKKIILGTMMMLLLVRSYGADVLITEFMAKNDKTLIDGNGNYSDWIELYNASDHSVDLTGWYLSDDSNELTKWVFPSKSIAAGEHLVVFASGQDADGYMDSQGYLHTTFKLSADGECVILTHADGTTIEHALMDYPEQDDDVSYGLAQESSYSTLVVEEQDATAMAGTYEPDSSWKTTGFDDSGWISGQTGVGYDKASTYAINLNLESGMFDESTRPPSFHNSAYIRVAFDVDDAAAVSQLALRMKYDDGFVAYINGNEVASANAPDSLSYQSSATAEHGGTSYVDYTLLNAGSYLQTGENVLAIQGLCSPFNPFSSSGDPDFYIMPKLTGITVGELITNAVMYYTTPTPGADNVQGIAGYVDDTKFTVDRGFFSNAFDVEIACDTEDSAIYYTIDGTTPSANNGTLYSNAISIDCTTVLRATATKTGYQSSDVDTQTYIFLNDIISQGTDVSSLAPEFPSSSVNGQGFDYGMDTDITESPTYSSQIEEALLAIPSISIVTEPDNLFGSSSGIYVNPEEEGEDWERETSIELIHPDGTDGFQINGGIRIRGASSAKVTNPKHSFRFFFRSEYGTTRLNYPLFGDEGADSFKRMDLRTGQNFSWANQFPQYATWLYDIFTRDTHRDMGQPYTRGEYYHLYINGMYWGLYQTEERCNADYAESYHGDDDDDYDAVKSDADTGVMYAVDGTRDAYDDLWTSVNSGISSDSAYFALQGMNSDGSENSSYTKLLDVDNVIDYMLLVYFTANRDSPVGPPMNDPTMPRNLNAIFNRTNPDGFKFVAHDNEHSLEISEGVDHDRVNQSLSSAFDSQDFFTPWWLHLKLMENEEYALRFADHVHDHFYNEGALYPTVTASRLEARKNQIYAAVIAESARWGDSTGTLYTRDDAWLSSVNWLLDSYMPYRSVVVLDQIKAKGWYPSVDAPEFNQHGGSIDAGFSLSISGSGTIYYTTDGSDPRAVSGAVAGTAYGSALTLTKSTHVKARVLSGGTWSALTDATFVLNESSPLRVTEMMYNPAELAAGSATNYSSTDFEFIEIMNAGSETIGLAGTEFAGGIYFDFSESTCESLAPGEYAVLVSNYEAFTNCYTNWASINIIGEYHGKFYISQGSLDNGGESIVLQDGLGNTILDFAYDDWYEITDGEGYSLTLTDPYAATDTWSDRSSWRPSAYTGGTPGYAAYDFPETGDLVMNEVLPHQDNDTIGDWIELYNASTNTIDINGWFLSDDDENLTKVTLSGLSPIAAGAYQILTEYAHFGTTAVGTNGFALSELGDAVYLSSGEGGVLTGYRVGENFGASDRDSTFGRFVKSDGTTDFPAMSHPTYSASNAYPAVGPIVISEIMYHPATSDTYEFVELYNSSSAEVFFYDADYPENTWRLDGAVDFAFPENFSLASGAYVIVSETTATVFTNAYTVPEGTTLLGPYDGKLNNSGESIRLERPGEPETDTGEIPEILVEKVTYDDESPWPTEADGGGYSLRRLNTAAYANDSANWSRSSRNPTPGQSDTGFLCDYTQCAVAGSFNDWNAAASNMTLIADHTWQWVASFSNKSDVIFKFAAAGSWDENWGDNNPDSISLPLQGTGESLGANITVNDTLDGTYIFTFNEQTMAYSLIVLSGNIDSDADGVPDEWEMNYFGSLTAVNGAPQEDWDEDGFSNYNEWYAGTDPTDPSSALSMQMDKIIAGTGLVMSWESAEGKTYAIQMTTTLIDGSFTNTVASDIEATSPVNVHTNPMENGCAFYRVIVQ